MTPDERRIELATNLAEVRERIALAATSAARLPDEVMLVVVTKTWPAEDVALLASMGVCDVAENRDQEAAPKAAALGMLGGPVVRWHFIGQLQRNKARSVARYADQVESVDRESLVAALSAARDPEQPLDVLIQVSLDGEVARGGSLPDAVPRLADLVESTSSLRLRGVMAVAPLDEDPRRAFGRLRELSERLRESHPEADRISAGMSGDLEAAIAEGATQVRIGTAVLGHRPALG